MITPAESVVCAQGSGELSRRHRRRLIAAARRGDLERVGVQLDQPRTVVGARFGDAESVPRRDLFTATQNFTRVSAAATADAVASVRSPARSVLSVEGVIALVDQLLEQLAGEHRPGGRRGVIEHEPCIGSGEHVPEDGEHGLAHRRRVGRRRRRWRLAAAPCRCCTRARSPVADDRDDAERKVLALGRAACARRPSPAGTDAPAGAGARPRGGRAATATQAGPRAPRAGATLSRRPGIVSVAGGASARAAGGRGGCASAGAGAPAPASGTVCAPSPRYDDTEMPTDAAASPARIGRLLGGRRLGAERRRRAAAARSPARRGPSSCAWENRAIVRA